MCVTYIAWLLSFALVSLVLLSLCCYFCNSNLASICSLVIVIFPPLYSVHGFCTVMMVSSHATCLLCCFHRIFRQSVSFGRCNRSCCLSRYLLLFVTTFCFLFPLFVLAMCLCAMHPHTLHSFSLHSECSCFELCWFYDLHQLFALLPAHPPCPAIPPMSLSLFLRLSWFVSLSLSVSVLGILTLAISSSILFILPLVVLSALLFPHKQPSWLMATWSTLCFNLLSFNGKPHSCQLILSSISVIIILHYYLCLFSLLTSLPSIPSIFSFWFLPFFFTFSVLPVLHLFAFAFAL